MLTKTMTRRKLSHAVASLALGLIVAASAASAHAQGAGVPAPVEKGKQYVGERFLVGGLVGVALMVLLRSSRRERNVKPREDLPSLEPTK